MNQQLRYIVDALNQAPYGKKFNLVTFSSLDSFSLLQVLNDVLAEISPEHRIDLRQEPPEQTAIRIFSLLRVLKYKPRTDEGGGLNAFRQGLLQGDKATVYPLLQWLLERSSDLKKRAYLARYLVRVEVPPEYLQDDTVLDVSATYEELLEQFKDLHRTAEQQRASKFSVAEVRQDITAMEEEMEQLNTRIARLRRKAEATSNHSEMLEAARKLRRERDRGEEVGQQRLEQKNLLLHTGQRLQRLQAQLQEERSASARLTATSLVERLEEENRLKTMLVRESLPRKLEAKQRDCIEMERVLSEPIMADTDLEALRREIEEASKEAQKLMEKRMPGSDPVQDKLTLFRQQTSIISRKKEAAMEAYQSVADDLGVAEQELASRREQLKQVGGGEVLREEEFKRYVSSLRGMNISYKTKRTEFSTLKAEWGVLARTEELLRSRDENARELAELLEKQRGVGGYRATQERLEHVSATKSKLDDEKGAVLQEMSDAVTQLTSAITEKKASLAPLIKEIRPLRQQHQELAAQHMEKKLSYDRVAAGLEGNRSHLEQEVSGLGEETAAEESRAHYLRLMQQSTAIQQARVAAEMKAYISGDSGEKRKSLRDQFTRRVQEQENLGKALRDKQREIRDTHADSMRQVSMWQELRRLLEVKRACFTQGQEQLLKEQAEAKDILAAPDRLVVS